MQAKINDKGSGLWIVAKAGENWVGELECVRTLHKANGCEAEESHYEAVRKWCEYFVQHPWEVEQAIGVKPGCAPKDGSQN